MVNDQGHASLAVACARPTHRLARNNRRTFRSVLQNAAPCTAQRLEIKAQTASWLAKIEPEHQAALYAIKHAALRQLFRIPQHAPTIYDAWATGRGFLVSLRLTQTGASLHFPFGELGTEVQRSHGAWIARRARGKHWQTALQSAGGQATCAARNLVHLCRFGRPDRLNARFDPVDIEAIASRLLAVIRGDLIRQQLKDAETQVVITDDAPTIPQNGNGFYEQALPLLQLVMALLAVAMELGAGLALHDAKRLGSDSGEDSEKVAQALMQVRLRMAGLGARVVESSNEGAIFEARFWRDFDRAMLTHAARKALGKLLALGLCLALVGGGTLRADEQRLNLVVLIDLSASVASKGPGGKTDFQKNVAAVTELLARVPAGSHVTVLGITGNSFAEPDILLQADLSDDAGYFSERLAAAHGRLVKAWRQRVAVIAPDARQTDILGALLVAGQMFHESRDAQTKRILVIYSDMRQETKQFNLEKPRAMSADEALLKVRSTSLLPDLQGTDVCALGVDAAHEDVATWERLRQLWAAYFIAAGANLRGYSALRNTPNLGPPAQ